jgi:hypothetical protein
MPLADICVLLPVSELATESAVRCQHELDPTETLGDHRHSTLDNLDTAREAADELIEALLFDAAGGPHRKPDRRFPSPLRRRCEQVRE